MTAPTRGDGLARLSPSICDPESEGRSLVDEGLAKVSLLVYEPFATLSTKLDRSGWELVTKPYNQGGTQAVLVEDRLTRVVALVFRGTEATRFNLADIWSNVGWPRAWQGKGKAHSGYADAFADIAWHAHDLIQYVAPDQPLYVTGHSMGGALATLYASWAKHRLDGLVTFGAPKAVDARAAANIRTPIRRYVLPMDFAPSWPPVILTHPAPETRLPSTHWWPGPLSRHGVGQYLDAFRADRV